MSDSLGTEPRDGSSSTAIDVTLRVVALVVMATLVLAGLAGAAGVRSRTVGAVADGLTLEARYGQVVRPGLAAPLEIVVSSNGTEPLPPELRVEMSSSYLGMFDENGFEPEPRDAWSSNGRTAWTYDVPDGERQLAISLDARVEPGVQMSRRPAVITVSADGHRPLSVSITSWVLP